MIRKIFVLDTSVMLYDKLAIHQFCGNDIVLPICILEELDKFKEKHGVLGESARYVNRYLDSIRNEKKDEDGWTITENDIRIRFVTKSLSAFIPESLDEKYTDNHIIACAKYLSEKHEKAKVIVITKDINLRVKCDAVGVQAQDYIKDHVNEDAATNSGWSVLEIDNPSDVDEFYSEGQINYTGQENFYPNHFIVGKCNNQSFLGINNSGIIQKLNHKMEGMISVEPRNSEQSFAIEALLNQNIPLVTLTGMPGSGKTFLTLMAGLSKINTKRSNQKTEELNVGYERLIITRTLQPVGKDLGYLPGTMEDKMAPWLMPIIDNVRHAFKDITYFQMMIEKGDIEVAPIPYIRGRTFNNSFVIVDEAQNATIHELKTIITRMGQNSKLVLLGDIDQIDTPYIDRRSSGLSIVIDKFKNSKLAAHVNLSKGQRSDLASEASVIL
jgi:PhoH-like ATPase